MKMHPQIISQKGTPAFVVLPYDEYETIVGLLEDIIDLKAVQAAKNDKSERFPLTLIHEIAEGKPPIKAYREYRKLTQSDLADKVSTTKQYISQLESGERKGTMQILKKIAKCLKVSLEDII